TALQLDVDHARRSSIRAHHSATHLLHEALRQVLGDHIAQRGSLVAPDRLRFDFVHPKPITPEELARVEDIANDVVLENDEVTTRLMGVDDAREAGARALFGEKYGDEVRVVSMGRGAREHGANALGWSVELCGGTHVRRTGDIGLISVTGESAVASGVRRIEAKDLKGLVDDGKKQIGSGVVAIVGVTEDGKAGIVVGVTSDLTSRFNAVELVRKGSEALGGKGGGGRPDMAQAGGPDGAKAN